MNNNYVIVNGELKHYGVKGMKWGHRKAKAFSDKAAKARTRGNEDAAAKFDAKSADMKKYAERNKKQGDIKAQRGLGSKVAMNLWAGPFANRTYNAVRAAGGSKGKALAITTVTAMVGGPIGHIAVAELYGHGVLGSN